MTKNQNVKEPVMLVECNDFAKYSIKKCYDLLHSYVQDLSIGDEEALCSLETAIERERIAMPPEIFEQFELFISEQLEPVAYDMETVITEICEKKTELIEPEGMQSFTVFDYLMLGADKMTALEDFGMRILNPILMR